MMQGYNNARMPVNGGGLAAAGMCMCSATSSGIQLSRLGRFDDANMNEESGTVGQFAHMGNLY